MKEEQVKVCTPMQSFRQKRKQETFHPINTTVSFFTRIECSFYIENKALLTSPQTSTLGMRSMIAELSVSF